MARHLIGSSLPLLVLAVGVALISAQSSLLGSRSVSEVVSLLRQNVAPTTTAAPPPALRIDRDGGSPGTPGANGQPGPDQPQPAPPTRTTAQENALLTAADNNIRANANEQNFRIQFNRRSGAVEGITPQQAADTSVTKVSQTRRLVEVTNQTAGRLFDAGANGRSGEVNEVSEMVQDPCIYDVPNSLPCNSPFRTASGRCTNTADGRKTWGMAGTPYTRLLSPKYEDNGVGSRRVTEFASGLPFLSARAISTTVSTTNLVLNNDGISAHIMQWGQFIAHEFTQLRELEPDAACCPDQIFRVTNRREGTRSELADIRDLVTRLRGDVCMQIELLDDPVYKEDVCMTHTRSTPAPLHNCALGPRQQMNAITHVFDASNVYGSSLAEQNDLRASSGGRLKSVIVNGAKLPPQDTNGCPLATQNQGRCPFLGGDSRINTTPNLISAHTTFVNKHNQIADRLRSMTSWGNDRLFEETRRIMSAIQSNIHFYQWLPIVVGPTMINKYQLGSYQGLNSNVNPSILNEMAGAAMRFGHSLINGQFSLEKDNGFLTSANLRPSFFDSDLIYDDGTRQCIKGLSRDRPWRVDKNFPEEMRDFLFDQQRDIVSLNLNRGRDHGFNSYADYRRHYGLSVNLFSTHTSDVRTSLLQAYTGVEDIELYIAAVSERPMSGALVGELFGNILADGFSRVRNGDRFFFESSQSGLTPAQIAEIRRYSYAQLLCEAHEMTRVQSNPFFRNGFQGSTSVACKDFTPLNLNLWTQSGSSPMSTPPPPGPTPHPNPYPTPRPNPYPTPRPSNPYPPRPSIPYPPRPSYPRPPRPTYPRPPRPYFPFPTRPTYPRPPSPSYPVPTPRPQCYWQIISNTCCNGVRNIHRVCIRPGNGYCQCRGRERVRSRCRRSRGQRCY